MFFYPPHAGSKHKIRREDLGMYDTMSIYIAQRKFNGTHVVIWISADRSEVKLWDRRGATLTLYKLTPGMFRLLTSLNLDNGKEYVLDGELLHTKAKSEITGSQAQTNTIVLFDVLLAGEYLRIPTERRLSLLSDICRRPTAKDKKKRALVVGTVDESSLWLAEVWDKDFLEVFDDKFDYHAKTGADKYPEIEGLMLKQRSGTLLPGDTVTDVQWMLKCRKEKPNMYRY